MRSCCGWSKNGSRRIDLDDLAVVHEHDPIRDLARKSHLMGDDDHGHAVLGERGHGFEHLLDHLGVERGSRFVKQHDFRIHAERARDRDALLLAAGKLARIFLRLLGNLDPGEQRHRQRFGVALRHMANPDRRERAILKNRQVRKEVEALEHHADLAAHLIDALDVRRQLHPVDHDRPALMLLEPIDAANERGLARSGRAANDNALPAPHRQVDVAQRVKGAIPLVDADELDCSAVSFRRGHESRMRVPWRACARHRRHSAPSRSRRRSRTTRRRRSRSP